MDMHPAERIAHPESPIAPSRAELPEHRPFENSRGARPGEEPLTIHRDRILVVPKLSKFEYDMQRLGVDEEALVRLYESEHVAGARIIASHEAQKAALRVLQQELQTEQFIPRNELTADAVRNADLVIAFGGDNHFQFVSHVVESGFILGINSDPTRSEGALVQQKPEHFRELLDALASGSFAVQEWTRLEGTVDGRPLPRVVCEFFLGERDRLDMSRYILSGPQFHEEQKSSGIIVTTGAGSTGWYASEIQDYLGASDIFARTAPQARLFVTSPFRGRLSSAHVRHQVLEPGQILEIGSLNDSEGIVGCDALERVPFPRGSVARVRLSDTPLKVLLPSLSS